MVTRKGEAVWEGTLHDGKGQVKAASGAFDLPYSLGSRVESAAGTNPEELLAAAHAGCFTMALSAMLSDKGIGIKRIHTTASVSVERIPRGLSISSIELATEAELSGCDEAAFLAMADEAKQTCAISKLVSGATVTLKATFKAVSRT